MLLLLMLKPNLVDIAEAPIIDNINILTEDKVAESNG